jgi:hypothetical protein
LIPTDEPQSAWNSRLKLKNEEDTKALLFDLVTSHTFSTTAKDEDERGGLEVDDIITGKGKGLVILLYGMALWLSLLRKEHIHILT